MRFGAVATGAAARRAAVKRVVYNMLLHRHREAGQARRSYTPRGRGPPGVRCRAAVEDSVTAQGLSGGTGLGDRSAIVVGLASVR